MTPPILLPQPYTTSASVVVYFSYTPPKKKVPSPGLALCRSQVRDIYAINLVYRVQRGRLQPRYLAAVADGEGVFLAVFALHAAVSQPDVEGAIDGARILDGTGVEDRYGLFGVA